MSTTTPEQLEQMIRKHNISLVSFDIFDTLITRPLKSPKAVFGFMQQHNPRIPKNFQEMRVQAEQIARKTAPGGECTLAEIYEVLGQQEQYTPDICRMLYDMEMETELHLCKPREEGASLLKKASELDVRVILISDMYLSNLRISRILCKCGIKDFEELYVSGEIRKSKATGDLYRYVRQKEELPFSTMLHIGDNPISDVIIPRNLGMRSIFLPLNPSAQLPEQNGLFDRVLPRGSKIRNFFSGIRRAVSGV